MLCASASVRDEANCVPSACCYSGRYVCDTTDKLEATEVQWSFGLCAPGGTIWGAAKRGRGEEKGKGRKKEREKRERETEGVRERERQTSCKQTELS